MNLIIFALFWYILTRLIFRNCASKRKTSSVSVKCLRSLLILTSLLSDIQHIHKIVIHFFQCSLAHECSFNFRSPETVCTYHRASFTPHFVSRLTLCHPLTTRVEVKQGVGQFLSCKSLCNLRRRLSSIWASGSATTALFCAHQLDDNIFASLFC